MVLSRLRICLAWLLVFVFVSPAGAQEAPAYAESFRDLHNELGARYVFFDLKGIDWDAVGAEFMPRAEAVQDDAAFGLLVAELVARLEDSHARVLPGEAPLPTVDFPRWHPGFACLEDDRGDAVVYFVQPNSPANQAGVKPGMKLVSVDGKPAGEAISQMMDKISHWQGYSSQQYLRYHATRWCTRRVKRFEHVALTFEDTAGGALALTLPAAVDGGYVPRLPIPNPGIPDSCDIASKRLPGEIGYIYVRRIKKDLNAQLDRAVGRLADCKAIIIDVRGNSGGGFDSKTAHQNFTLDETQRDPNRPVFAGPMAVLIDSRCISAGEGWASWFVANQRATFFGEPTAGASARKDIYTLTNNTFKVRYSVKAYRGHLDRPIERLGLIPDVPVKQTRADLIAQKDTALEAARVHLLSSAE